MPEDELDVVVHIPASTMSVVFMADPDDVSVPETVIALVFHEEIADDVAEFIVDRYPMPEGQAVGCRLADVDPDELERWARG